MNHEHIQIHNIHHSPNLGEATTFPLIVLSMINQRGFIQMSSCPETPKLGVLKFSKLGFSAFWKPIIYCANLWLRWSLKQSCSPNGVLFNDMWHPTYTHVFQGDFWLLMGGIQIGTLIHGHSFDHNLCFKY